MSAAKSASAGGSIPLATIWVICGALGLTGMAVTVRYLEGRVPSWDLSFYRALTVLLIGIVPMLSQNRWRLSAVVPQKALFWDYLLRGLLIFAAQAAYYYALMHMKFADATVLNATVPIFSALLAIFMLSERVSPDRWLLIFIGFAGVVLIIQPGFQTVTIEATFALLSAVLFSLSGILNKRLVKIASGTQIVYGTNFFVALCGTGVVIVWGVKPTWADLGIVALIGTCGAAAQYCFSQALLHADVSYVSPFEFVRVPFAALAGWVLFDEPPPLIFGAGAALIFLSVLLLARRAARARLAAAPDAV